MNDFKYISNEEKEKLKKDEKKAANGRKLFKAAKLMLVGIGAATFATLMGVPATGGFAILGIAPIVTDLIMSYFGEKSYEKFKKKYDDMKIK